MERTGLLDVDVIVWLDADPEQEPLANPLYQNLDVHQEGREVFHESYTDPLGAATRLSRRSASPISWTGSRPCLPRPSTAPPPPT